MPIPDRSLLLIRWSLIQRHRNLSVTTDNREATILCSKESPDFHMAEPNAQLKKSIDTNPTLRSAINMDEVEDPAAIPVLWISKWVDVTEQAGFDMEFLVTIVFQPATV